MKRISLNSPVPSPTKEQHTNDGQQSRGSEVTTDLCAMCRSGEYQDSSGALKTNDCLCSSNSDLFVTDFDLLSSDINWSDNTNESADNAELLKTPPKKTSHISHHNRPYGYFKLENIYKRVFDRPPAESHCALADCKTLLEVLCQDYQSFTERIQFSLKSLRNNEKSNLLIRFSDVAYYNR